ncbi:MAG TPA: PSD1 and planctomycete cytochrome C domain-containing protein [Pirellulales bacterium]|nr:PSD1 and planctomycete cytochrome C domain-containing protein [Pirellulales bacterium]
MQRPGRHYLAHACLGCVVALSSTASAATTRCLAIVCAISVGLLIFATGLWAAADEAATAEQLFARKVYPVLRSRCFGCHGDDADDISGDLDLRTREAALKGGASGQPAFTAGDPDASPLYVAVSRRNAELAMPPKDNDKLSPDEIGAIRQWITGGAPWPAPARRAELNKDRGWNDDAGVSVPTSGGLSPEWTDRKYNPAGLWAYQPVKKNPPPKAQEPNIDKNEIDAFIDAGLASLGLLPAPPAARRTLIRRASFDLLGLPPTPEEVEAFLGDTDEDAPAFAKVVERLLASPHYGEQMARHWLDVVRYADSSGFANDYERGNAWRFRDYAVRAFNVDKPYDQFVSEQLAGDEIDPDNPELLVAVGFLRMGPWELTAMEVPKVARQRFLDDVTNNVGETFLAHSLQCARCHDHKFDPVPTRDYYGVQACFATTQMAERPAAFLPRENTIDGFQDQVYLERRKQRYEEQLAELDRKSIEAARRWLLDNHLDPAEFEQALTQKSSPARPGGVARREYEQARSRMIKRGVPEERIPPRFAGLAPEELGRDRISRKGLERLAWELDRYRPFAFSVYDGPTPNVSSITAPRRLPGDRQPPGEIEQTCILAGGDPFSPTVPVVPGVLSVVTTVPDATIPESLAGRRRALARWIVDRRNPLTSRVIANRVWQWHFGRGLAANPNNFGATGKPPTHAELLDWLAATLVERGWSLKDLHRTIMASAAYRRSCEHPDRRTVDERGPADASYAVFLPRRLTAEELRDGMLRVSGELNPVLGGVPVRPEINLEAALQPRQVMGALAAAWTPSPSPQDRHRRSIYALKLRGLRDPFYEVFNEPNPDLSCERREAATVVPQVFSLFNSQASYDRAAALASLVLKGGCDDEAAVQAVYRRAFGRPATPDEAAVAMAHWRRMTVRHEKLVLPKPAWPREVVRETVEENTGTKFNFVEPLDEYADFTPDLQLTGADARTRGFAEVCLVIFNSNEFVYVY